MAETEGLQWPFSGLRLLSLSLPCCFSEGLAETACRHPTDYRWGRYALRPESRAAGRGGRRPVHGLLMVERV